MNKQIAKAIELVGSQADLAKLIGSTQPGVNYLLHHAKKVKAKTAEAIAKATNHRVTRYDLRPDLFPAPRKRA